MLPVILVAAAAAGAILLIVAGLSGGRAVDPVQARLSQLGTMQAKNLEELELQTPFLERTLRPLAGRLSGSVSRITSTSFADRTEKSLALAGNPGDLRVADWLGIKAVVGDHLRDRLLPALRRRQHPRDAVPHRRRACPCWAS